MIITIEQDLVRDIENVLDEDETVSSFVLDAIKLEVEARNDFLARAILSRTDARETGIYFNHEEVMGELREMLERSKQEKKK